jgi:hypothetical protein
LTCCLTCFSYRWITHNSLLFVISYYYTYLEFLFPCWTRVN